MFRLLLVLILFGLIAGALARLFVPGPDPMSIPMTIALGIAGSFVGGLFAALVFGTSNHAFRPAGLLGSVLGAMMLLLAYRWVEHRHRSAQPAGVGGSVQIRPLGGTTGCLTMVALSLLLSLVLTALVNLH